MTHLFSPAEPVEVAETADGLPASLLWRGRHYAVAGVANRWRAEESWWADEAWREYFKLATTDGLLCVLYRDLHTGKWYCARIYD
jgi:hypothetical protein